MSTKQTIDHNIAHPKLGDVNFPDFHLYKECFEKGFVYLEVEDTKKHPLYFCAEPGAVTIKLPADLWNRIIKAGPILTIKEEKAAERKWRRSKEYKEYMKRLEG